MYEYGFSVNAKRKIDYRRIIREDNREDGGDHEILLVVPRGYFAVLLVSPAFLKNFDLSDALALGGEFLHSSWGFSTAGRASLPRGWRRKYLKVSDIPEIVRQLKTARAIIAEKQRIIVKVHSL